MKHKPVFLKIANMYSSVQQELSIIYLARSEHLIPNPNKAGRLEGSFSGGGVNLTPLRPFIFQEELIEYQYIFIQLLNNIFKVC